MISEIPSARIPGAGGSSQPPPSDRSTAIGSQQVISATRQPSSFSFHSSFQRRGLCADQVLQALPGMLRRESPGHIPQVAEQPPHLQDIRRTHRTAATRAALITGHKALPKKASSWKPTARGQKANLQSTAPPAPGTSLFTTATSSRRTWPPQEGQPLKFHLKTW